MMEYGCECPVVFYYVIFFFVVKVNTGRFHDHNKMGPIEKNYIQEILYKMYYSLFKLTVLD